MVVLAFAGIAWVGGGVVAAPPTTRPVISTKGWVAGDDPKHQLRWLVPPSWKKSGHTKQSVDYEIPVPPDAAGEDNHLDLVANPAEHRTLAQSVAGRRNSYGPPSDTDKLVTDKATTLGGQPAWLFVDEQTYTPDTPGAKPKKRKRAAANVRKRFVYRVIAINGDDEFDISYAVDVALYDAGLPEVQKALETCTWGGKGR